MTETRPAAPLRERKLGARLYGLDGLRFLAAVAVMLHHYTARWSQVWDGREPGDVFPVLGHVAAYAALGPEMFFVLSGFVILMTAWGRDVPHVVASRVARLYPSYWIAVVATSVLLLWLWPAGKDITLAEALVNLTMFQEAFDVRHVDGVYWTLWAELRFYVLIVLLTAWGITRRRILAFAALWPLAAELLAPVVGNEWFSQATITGYAPFFAGGMMLYLIYRDGHRPLPWLILAMNVSLAVRAAVPAQVHRIGANTVFEPNPWIVGAIAVLCFVAVGAVALTRLRELAWRWLLTAGALTYPLYLTHEYWGWWVIDHLYAAWGRWGTLAAAVAMAFLLAWLVHQAEKRIGPPLRRSLERRLRELSEGLRRLTSFNPAQDPTPAGQASAHRG